MLTEELLLRKRELMADIEALEARIEPLRKDLGAKRERLLHVAKLLELESGITTVEPNDEPQPGLLVQYGRWTDICRTKGWNPGADSAHRVVMRRDPALHMAVAHECGYDGRQYP